MEFYKSEHDILVLQNRMGHASIAATNIYARASDKRKLLKSLEIGDRSKALVIIPFIWLVEVFTIQNLLI